MNTRIIMTASALFLAILGLGATFLPQEILNALHLSIAAPLPLVIQIVGALYLGFGMLNWTAKDSLIGGIYNRPVLMGNVMQFTVGALALVKSVFAGQRDPIVVTLAVLYAIFAIAFAKMFFTSPVKGQQE